MGEVKWIKFVCNFFDNRKIKQIRKMPEADAIIVIWWQLLSLSANVNDHGLVYFTTDIPYNEEMLANEFDRNLNTIRLALNTFVRFGMIEIIDNIIQVSNWDKYQNADALEKIRYSGKQRAKKYRESKKIGENDVKMLENNVTVTLRNASVTHTEEELEIELEEEVESNINVTNKGGKKKSIRKPELYLDHVYLTDEEVDKLGERANEYIHYLNMWLEENPAYRKKSKNHYMTICRWVKDAVHAKKPDWLITQ